MSGDMVGHVPDEAFEAVANDLRLARCTEVATSKDPFAVLELVSDGLVVAAPYIAAAALERMSKEMSNSWRVTTESIVSSDLYRRARELRGEDR